MEKQDLLNHVFQLKIKCNLLLVVCNKRNKNKALIQLLFKKKNLKNFNNN